MKRYFLAITMILAIAFPMGMTSASTLQTQESSINYIISYRTEIIGTTKIKLEGDMNAKSLTRFRKTFNADITDPTVVSELENYKQQALKEINQTTPNAVVSDRTFIDGYVYSIPSEGRDNYLRFFELSEDFNGTNVIVKDGVSFQVTGDGNGNFTMTTVNDFVGIKQKSFIIPEEKSHTIAEEITNQDFFASYYVPNSVTQFLPNGRLATYTGSSLQDVLDHCAQYADPNREIRISVTQTCFVTIDATSSRKMFLNVTYGNTYEPYPDEPLRDNQGGNDTEETTPENNVVPGNDSQSNDSQNNNSQNELIIPNSPDNKPEGTGTLEGNEIQNGNNELPDSNDATNQSAVTQTDEDENLGEKTDENTKRSNAFPLENVIALCIAFALILAIFSIFIFKKYRTKKH